jgi:hypothetical protein
LFSQASDFRLQGLDLVFVPLFQLLDLRLEPLKGRGIVGTRACDTDDPQAA